MYPIFGRKCEEISSNLGLWRQHPNGSYTFQSQQEKEEFAKAYEEDLLTLKYSDISGSELLGTMSISYEPEHQEVKNGSIEANLISDEDNGYPILRSFTRTIQVLEQFGVVFPDTLDPNEVRALTVWYENNDFALNLLAVGAGETDLISDSQKKELFEHAFL